MRLDSRPVHDMVFNMVLGDALDREKKPWAYLKATVHRGLFVHNEISHIVLNDLHGHGYQGGRWE